MALAMLNRFALYPLHKNAAPRGYIVAPCLPAGRARALASSSRLGHKSVLLQGYNANRYKQSICLPGIGCFFARSDARRPAPYGAGHPGYFSFAAA